MRLVAIKARSRRDAAVALGLAGALLAGLLAASVPAMLPSVAAACAYALGVALLSRALPWGLAALMPILLIGLLAPQSVAASSQFLFLAIGGWMAARGFVQRQPNWLLAALAMAVPGYWTLEIFHPNVPDLATGALGLRKACLVFASVSIGVMLHSERARHAQTLLPQALLLAGGASILLHLGAPQIEQGFARGADVYTSLFMGELRMQGFYAGPFHISLMGSFLSVWGASLLVTRTRTRLEASAFILIGAALVILAAVRTGYVSIAVALLALPLVAAHALVGGPARRAGMLLVIAAVAIGGLAWSGALDDSALGSVAGLASDQRALGRVTTWSESIDAIVESPVFGWGAGSAGSALGSAFGSGLHVTAHNMLLAYAVEGGVIGLALVGGVLFLLIRASANRFDLTRPTFAALVPLFVFGMTGEVAEAIPVSLVLVMLLAISVVRGQKPNG